jgi:hypothetical protein
MACGFCSSMRYHLHKIVPKRISLLREQSRPVVVKPKPKETTDKRKELPRSAARSS